MTKDGFIKKIKDLYKNDYILVSDFISTQSKVTIKHNKCGNNFDIVANEFTRLRVQERFRKACTKCREIAIPLEEVQKRLDKITKDRISIIGSYQSTHKDTTFKCKVCSHEWTGNVHYKIQNVKTNKTDSFGCPKCSKKMKKTTEIFKKEVKELVGNEYLVKGEYSTANDLVEMTHTTCGEDYPVRPADFLYKNNRCPYCANNEKESKAVRFIRTILMESSIKCETEKDYEDCIYKKKLPFDFYFPELNLLLEYDGEQHFRNMGGLFNDFENTRIRDNIKNQWCINNDINFLRLHYKMNFEDIRILIENLIKGNLEMSIVEKYNLFYKSDESEILNEKEYYLGINKKYYV